MIIGLYSSKPGSGKTTVARVLQSKGYSIESFAQPLRSMIATMLSSMGMEHAEVWRYLTEDKEKVIPLLGVSARHMLRTLGTEWGRECIKPSIWTDHWLHRVSRKSFTVVDDVRFLNEAELIQSLGGQMWCINRPGVAGNTDHASEGSLNYWDRFDVEIENDGTILDLVKSIPKVPKGPAANDSAWEQLEEALS